MNRKVFMLITLVLLILGGEIGQEIGKENVPPSPSELTHVLAKDSYLQKDSFQVTRVIDGDTIEVDINGTLEKVRLIGVNTPETVDPRKKVECFGKEASRFVTGTLSKTSVFLEADTSQGERDRYGRLLRYVFLLDGTLLNKMIITEGYGYEYTYRVPYRYMNEFNDAERTAQKLEKGLWAKGVCG